MVVNQNGVKITQPGSLIPRGQAKGTEIAGTRFAWRGGHLILGLLAPNFAHNLESSFKKE